MSLDVRSENSFNKTCVRAGNCRSGEVKECLTSLQEKLGSYETRDGDNDDQTLVNRYEDDHHHHHHHHHHHWAAVLSRGWAKASTCRLQVSLSCVVLCRIVSLQYLSRSSLHRLAGVLCRLFLSDHSSSILNPMIGRSVR